jgi:hypothetical protein
MGDYVPLVDEINVEILKWWWNTPIDYFGSKTPSAMLEENPIRVINYVRGLSETVVNLNLRDKT